jgi:hypothetical protein
MGVFEFWGGKADMMKAEIIILLKRLNNFLINKNKY